ncbi:hypothetical protein [Hyphomonas johnsonii]|uniref:SMODS and SLOG-associating 2TM effector domain-containing protein n=1 Tax=Hyphomonas johnsonii MHS-2 TaxID=1280950 RepID=A0A059F9N9_9PROT|nr:hypothetical protein [Hyphomonas johnsonii]KCZ87329.1 hypothetical protein HJO_16822 [Hyphomonas johnsonii MHS-2]
MFRFNDELLLKAEDLALAQKKYPRVFFALDHPELRAEFQRIDHLANSAKNRSRSIGCLTLTFAVASLLTFPLEPLIRAATSSHGHPDAVFTAIAIVGAVCGVLAIIFGNLGLAFGQSKRRWLQMRLMTERMRQWKAQYIVAHIADIVAAAGSPEREAAYVEARSLAFERFQRSFLNQISSEYTKYTRREAVGHMGHTAIGKSQQNAFWIDASWAKAAARKLTPDPEGVLAEILSASEETRLLGQVQYTNYILSAEGKFWSLPRKQIAVLGNIMFALVLLAFLSNFVALLIAIWPVPSINQSVVGSIGIMFAILAVGTRSVEEGLHPQRELARMELYAAQVDAARHQFIASNSPARKVDALKALEKASNDEMIEFLDANEHARFVL